VGNGKPGPVCRRLSGLFKKDMTEGTADVRTPIGYDR